MEMQDQVQLAAEHARRITAEITTHKDLSARLRLLTPYYFEFQRQYALTEALLLRQESEKQLASPKSVPDRPKLSVIRGGK